MQLRVGVAVNNTLRVSIYSNVSDLPGTSLKVLTNPSSLPTALALTDFDADDYWVTANTTYWIVAEHVSGSGQIGVSGTLATAEDAGGAPGWYINDSGAEKEGGPWIAGTANYSDIIPRTAIKGEPSTDDATLSGLALEDSGGTAIALDPTFDSGVTEYTATVSTLTEQIKVTATKADTDASIEYLDENDMELADADTTTTDVLDVDLDEGENTIKVKVTKGTATLTYTVTVTRVDFLVSNLGRRLSVNVATVGTAGAFAAQFTTGSHDRGYKISAVQVTMSVPSGVTPRVSIYSDSSNEPGSSVKVLSNPAILPTSRSVVEFDAEDFLLDEGTKYWVVVERASGSGNVLVSTSKLGSDPGTAPGWSIRATGLDLESGSWTLGYNLGSTPPNFAVKGGVVTDDTTLDALAVEDSSGNAVALDPTFASGTTEYSATVGNSVTRIKVTPTKSDSAATIEYLDENNAAITDADATTMNVLDVDLEVGENTVKVKVTKGGNSQTYVIIVTRQATITLTASHTSIIRELHELTFTLTRSDLTAETAEVTIRLENAAGGSAVSSSGRSGTVSFGLNDASVDFIVPNFWIRAGQAGDIVATVEAGPKYDASGATATVELVFPSGILLQFKLDQASYEVDEGETLMFNVVANFLEAIAAPNKDLAIVSFDTVAQTAKLTDDYTSPSLTTVRIPAASWSLVSNRYTASVPYTVATVYDSLYERPMGDHEYFEIALGGTVSTPRWVERLGPSMGTTNYPVTIIDNETLSIEATLSSTGLTASDNLVIAEDAGNTVTLEVTATGEKPPATRSRCPLV